MFNLYAGAPEEIKVEDIPDVVRWVLECQEAAIHVLECQEEVILDPSSILARGSRLSRH